MSAVAIPAHFIAKEIYIHFRVSKRSPAALSSADLRKRFDEAIRNPFYWCEMRHPNGVRKSIARSRIVELLLLCHRKIRKSKLLLRWP
ncbi:hypothetical protein AB0F52_39200 [Amycolatopsis sp. NPDC024027]|uniref:hypothetical protein n=1 Tax=Amycolatopsis sp. NPDC024027 TaxID=3154327 RepID=UPI0033E7717A